MTNAFTTIVELETVTGGAKKPPKLSAAKRTALEATNFDIGGIGFPGPEMGAFSPIKK